MVSHLGTAARGARWLPSPGTLAAALFLALLALVQTSVLPYFEILGAQPSLILVSVVILATMQVGTRALGWGFGGGLLVDLFSAAPLGTNALLFTLIAYVAGGGFGGVDRANLLIPVVAVALATAAYYPSALLALQLQGIDVAWEAHLPARLWPAIVVNLGASAVLYYPVRVLERWTHGRPIPTFRGVR